jgi:hypothetical protein
MAGLSVEEIVDLSVLLLAHEERPREAELARRLGDLSGQWFTPDADLVRDRVAALVEGGCLLRERVHTPAGPRLTATAAGLGHARALGAKAAPAPCAAAMLLHGLRLSLHDLSPRDQRGRTFLDLARADARLPAMTAMIRDLGARRPAAE